MRLDDLGRCAPGAGVWVSTLLITRLTGFRMMARLMPSDDIASHPFGYYRGVLGSSIEPEAPALPGACFYSLCIGGAPNRPHTGGAGDLREIRFVCNVTVGRSSWAQVHMPSSSTSKPPVAARRDLCGEWYPSHLRSFPGASSSLPLFFRSHMTTLGRPARLRQSLPR